MAPSPSPARVPLLPKGANIHLPTLVTAFVLAATPQHPTVEAALAALHRVVEFHRVAISPDGEHVAWVEAVATPDGPSGNLRTIHLADRSGSAPARLTAAANGSSHEEDEPIFSPDGSRVAFLSDAEAAGQPQLYVAELKSGSVRRLTHVTGHLERPRWAPDGRRLAVLFLEGAADARGPLGPSARETGVIASVVREQRIALVGAEGGELTPVSPSDLFIYEYGWSPDGTRFVATGAHGDGDNNWWTADLFLVPASGGAATRLYHPKFQLCEPTWSPDGTRLAFVEGLMSDAGANGGDVFVVPAAGGRARNLTPGMRASATQLNWSATSGLVAMAVMGGDSAFLQVDADRAKAPVVVWRGPELVRSRPWGASAAFASDGKSSAVIRESELQPPDIFAGVVGGWTRVSRANATAKSPAAEVRSLTWTSDGREVQGWLVLPPAEATTGKPALVVEVHGGPASAATNSFEPGVLVLVSQGYAVFLPNPRGSFGQGEAFTRANVKDFGHGDLRDIVAGVDRAASTGAIDGSRVGITGHSYGGYMTMFAVTQTTRFKAAVASAGISNWQSYYGENKIDQWMVPYFGASVYADPAAYARSSPINFITQVKTPTLVLVGERDAECPASQSFEFWHALKTLGVPTELVVYADEGHHFLDPAHVLDRTLRQVAWLDRYLAGVPAAAAR